MKKFILSCLTIFGFAFYTFSVRQNENINYVAPQTTAENTKNSYATPYATPASTTKPTSTTKSSTTSSTAVTKPKGMYRDGSFTGNSADAYYGYIQVEAVIRNGVLSDVIFLDHPQDRGTSIRINEYAMPILKSEAISAQSANVAIVSGATDSSIAFRESLAQALSKAKN